MTINADKPCKWSDWRFSHTQVGVGDKGRFYPIYSEFQRVCLTHSRQQKIHIAPVGRPACPTTDELDAMMKGYKPNEQNTECKQQEPPPNAEKAKP